MTEDTTEAPVVECPNCGQEVLEIYVESGRCPDCPEENG